ncbi:hypothetical protein BDW66DRAFT_90921 [Aspergillus desertorum]
MRYGIQIPSSQGYTFAQHQKANQILHSIESIFKEENLRPVVPHSRFSDAWLAISRNAVGEGNAASRRTPQRICPEQRPPHLLDARLYHRIKTRSVTQLFRKAFWSPSRIPDVEIPESSHHPSHCSVGPSKRPTQRPERRHSKIPHSPKGCESPESTQKT